jgi:hypothetical protein
MSSQSTGTEAGPPAARNAHIARDRHGLPAAPASIEPAGGSGLARPGACRASTPTCSPRRASTVACSASRWPGDLGLDRRRRTPTRTPTRTRPRVFAGIREAPRAALTCTDAHERTSADVLPVPDTEEVTGSIPVSPTSKAPGQSHLAWGFVVEAVNASLHLPWKVLREDLCGPVPGWHIDVPGCCVRPGGCNPPPGSTSAMLLERWE